MKKKITLLEGLYHHKRSISPHFFSPLEKEIFYKKHIEFFWNLFSPVILAKGDGKPHTLALQKLLFIEHVSQLFPDPVWRGH